MKSTLLKVGLALFVLLAVMVFTPQSAFSQRGGHMGRGGFHGGFGGVRSGGIAGGHGGGFGGLHGRPGFGGFNNGPWGFPRFGSGFGLGFGFGIGFGFGSYWPYPYPYYGYDPYYYPYAYPCSYPYYPAYPGPYCYYPNNFTFDGSAPPYSVNRTALTYPRTSASTRDALASTATVPHYAKQQTGDSISQNGLLSSNLDRLPVERRRVVRNVIVALRAMPPEARQRQINSGRYNLSSNELAFVHNTALDEVRMPTIEIGGQQPRNSLSASGR
jgi:hypothetical protein